jgi:hypothetical protein
LRNEGSRKISENRGLFGRDFLQLTVDPQLDAPHGEQLKFGLGLAAHDPVADPELPFPGARRACRHGVFDALVNHANVPNRPKSAFNPNIT